MGSFSDFQYGFRSYQSIADLPKAVSDINFKVFYRYGATIAVALDISKTFGKVWHFGLLDTLQPLRFLGQVFGFISSFLRNKKALSSFEWEAFTRISS